MYMITPSLSGGMNSPLSRNQTGMVNAISSTAPPMTIAR